MTAFSSLAIKALWKRSEVVVWPSFYYMVSYDPTKRAEVLSLAAQAKPVEQYVSVISDHHEVAAILPQNLWDKSRSNDAHQQSYGPLVCLTLNVPLDIEVSGYLQPAVHALADAGVSIVPQCALIFDHLLVHEKDAETALGVLTELRRQASM